MDIHVVQPGDTMYQLARQYGVPMERLLQDNQLENPAHLVVGQTIVVQYPQLTHTVRAGDSLYSIAQTHGSTVKQLLRNNPTLQGRDLIFPGQVLVVRYETPTRGQLTVNSYAYPYISRDLLRATLPYQSRLIPFAYRFTANSLIPLQDESIVSSALQSRVAPLLCLANLNEQDQFSSELVHQLLASESQQDTLIRALLEALDRRGYLGIDIDFEYVHGEDAAAYAQFLTRLRQQLRPREVPLSVALPAKSSAGQAGRLFEGADYHLIAQAVDSALLMTYDFGYISGPPMAVAPLPEVRKVVEYALTEFSPEQLYLGIPNYGYNWTLPLQAGRLARSLSNVEAVQLAWNRRSAIRYDEQAQSPWFRYVDGQGGEHEVWFEDARSIQAKLDLALEYGLYGVGYWNLDRPFPQNWVVLNATAQIRNEL